MKGLLVWLAACGGGATPEVDAARGLADALASRDPAACAALGSPELVGHCQNALGLPCEAVVDGPWREECHFARAEAAGPAEVARFVPDCVASGRFAQECFTHLFKAELQPALEAAGSQPDALALTLRAEALVAAWAEAGSGAWSPPWGWWWRRLHQVSSPVDRARCEPLEPAQRRACQREALSLLKLEWGRGLAGRPELCGLDAEGLRAALAADPRMAWAPNPDLDQAAVRALSEACGPR